MIRTAVLRLLTLGLIVPIFGLSLNLKPANLAGQPAFKLDVKPHLKPLSVLKLDGTKLSRTDLADDPGFRLQYHIKQADGKSVTTLDARNQAAIDVPTQTAGTYSVVLELFYPAFKSGGVQKGEFKPVSNVVTYKIDDGKVALIESPPPKDKK